MNKIKKRIKKKPILISTLIFLLLYLISSSCLLYSILRINNIENILRYLVSAFLLLLLIYLLLNTLKIILKGKNAGIMLLNMVFIVLFIITSYMAVTVNNLYSSISSIYKETVTYEVSVIVKSDSPINKINNINNSIIGITSKDGKAEINELSNEIIKENTLDKNNEIKEYTSSNEIIKALYDDEIDIAIVDESIFSTLDTYNNINTEKKKIANKTKSLKKDDKVYVKDRNEPFTILLLGMDSTIKNIGSVTSFNADSIMLITFNPKTYNATILSIPRDTYVPISCISGNPESKITHSGWNGENCVISTIEDWMGIKIDYYIKVNFTALVSLVDSIGGIEVDVPYSFCEQNSNREWGKNTVYVKEGHQTLNGEQALALSRNRHPNPSQCSLEWTNYYSDDIIRGQNQQLVLNAVINKAIKTLSLENIYSILKIIDTNVDTNMQINEITNYYSTIKEIALKTLNNNNNIINFERLQLSTYGKALYDPLLNMAGISMQIYYKESYEKIVNEMKTNLGLIEPTLIKNFSFSINNPYKVNIIGSGTFNQEDIKTVPNFVGKDVSIVQSWSNENSINIIIEYEENNIVGNNLVISQSINPTYRLDKIGNNQTFKIIVSKNLNIVEVEDEEMDDPIYDLLPE